MFQKQWKNQNELKDVVENESMFITTFTILLVDFDKHISFSILFIFKLHN